MFLQKSLYDSEYWAWDDDIREVFEERLAIMSDGGPITPAMDRIARMEARAAHVRGVSQWASNFQASFGSGLR